MTLDNIRNRIPDYARDLRLNLGSVTTTQGAPDLTEKQIWGSVLTAAISSRNTALAADLENVARGFLDDSEIEGARAAAAIMGMNNIYYRFLHMAGDSGYQELPARLRMNVIARPGIDKVDFELYSLVASTVTGCDYCVKAHERQLRQAGVTVQGIQSAARIAAVVHGVAMVLEHTATVPSEAAAHAPSRSSRSRRDAQRITGVSRAVVIVSASSIPTQRYSACSGRPISGLTGRVMSSRRVRAM